MPCERKHVEAIANAVFAADKNGCEFDCFCAICSAVGNVESAITSALDACDQSPWRSMDSAPRDGTWVFSIYAGAPFPRLTIETVQWIEDGWWTEDGSSAAPSHWTHIPMPLPEAPRKDET